MSETEFPKPPFLNRVLRCSACAKNLLYGILIFTAIVTTITIAVFEPLEIDHQVLAFFLLTGFASAVYILITWGVVQVFRAYCDKQSTWYDDGLMIFFGLAGCFVLFVLTLAIVYDFVSAVDTVDTPFFVRLWGNAFG